MDVFEIVIPYISTANKQTMLTTKVYAETRQHVSMFIHQHNIKVYDVNVLSSDSINKDFSEFDIINKFIFRSNRDNKEYEIYTTENIIHDAVDYIGEQLAEISMFGEGILHTDIPIIDIINRLLEKLKHTAILDYFLLDEDGVMMYTEGTTMDHFKTFSNKAFDLLPDSPSETDSLYDYIYESLHSSSYMGSCGKPEAITLEGYVEYIADWLTDKV